MTTETPTEAVTPLSIAAVRRMFPPGTRYIGEFIGANRKAARPGNIRTERTVRRQVPYEMVSMIETGPRAGSEIDLNWRGVTATMCGRIVTLYMPDPFLTMERIETAGDCR